MRVLALALGAALALSACGLPEAVRQDFAALTPVQKQCAVTNGATYATSVQGWSDMTYQARIAVVNEGAKAVAATCEIDSVALKQVQPLLEAALLAASRAQE